MCHKFWTHSTFGDTKPSEIFRRHFLNCFIDDSFGLKNLDSLWPEVPEYLWESIKHLTEKQIDQVTHLNAMRSS